MSEQLPTFTPSEVISMISECREAGKKAAEEELQLCLKEKNLTSPYIQSGEFKGCLETFDACGYGYPLIDTDQPFYEVASELSERHGDELNFRCHDRESRGAIFFIKGMTRFQDMRINIAAAKAVQKVLEAHGVRVKYLHTWVD